jgi:hypothetical protein
LPKALIDGGVQEPGPVDRATVRIQSDQSGCVTNRADQPAVSGSAQLESPEGHDPAGRSSKDALPCRSNASSKGTSGRERGYAPTIQDQYRVQGSSEHARGVDEVQHTHQQG